MAWAPAAAGGDRRADGAPEAVGDRHMPGGRVGQKRGISERRETTRPAFIGGMYRIGDLAEPADPGGDHRGSAFLFGLGCWRPTGLSQRFAGGDQRKLNKAIHLLRSFAGMVASGSKPCSGSLSMDGTWPATLQEYPRPAAR